MYSDSLIVSTILEFIRCKTCAVDPNNTKLIILFSFELLTVYFTTLKKNIDMSKIPITFNCTKCPSVLKCKQ